MNYRVEVTPDALDAIRQHVRHIAVELRAPLNAERWLQRVWDAVDSLERFPRRCSLAPDNEQVTYEVRMQTVGDYLLLFTVDDETKTVWVLGFRHGSRLPRRGDLPSAPPAN